MPQGRHGCDFTHQHLAAKAAVLLHTPVARHRGAEAPRAPGRLGVLVCSLGRAGGRTRDGDSLWFSSEFL